MVDIINLATVSMELIAALPAATERFKVAATQIRTAYARRAPAASDQVTPTQLIDALEQFLSVASNLDREEGETGPILMDDVNQLGDYGLNLLADLAAWAQQLGLKDAYFGIGMTSLTIADWTIRHLGRIRSPEPVVNALADAANRTTEAGELERMARFMGEVIHACDSFIQQDMEKTNPGRPWRLLHLNRGIVATRSHNPALMTQVFDELVRALPEEAPGFFEQGMQQMEALNYPPTVREVMERYRSTWSRPVLH